MEVSELETKLNNSVTSLFKFGIKESQNEDQNVESNGDFLKLGQVYQGEIIIYLVTENDKEEILKIMPSHDEIDRWYISTESAACLFGADDLRLYIEILRVVAAFLQRECAED